MPSFKLAIGSILLVLCLSTVNLWLKQGRTAESLDKLIKKEGVSQLASSPLPENRNEAINELKANLIELLGRVEKLETTPSPSPVLESVSTISSWQPQNIYLGSASSHRTEWTETSAAVILNSSDYPADVYAIFEAQLSIIGGEAWVRLKNKTTGAVMPITELSHNTNTATWKSSPAFKLHSGTNTYVVELRSTSNEMANLSGARIKISR